MPQISLLKIISGGQTGADQAGLYAAKELGIETGGAMPQRFKTESGPRPEFRELFNITESLSPRYRNRTMLNVALSDVTILFGKDSAGSRATKHSAQIYKRPLFYVPWQHGDPFGFFAQEDYINQLNEFLVENNPATINIAGNRESVNPGIFDFTKQFLIKSFSEKRNLFPAKATANE